MDIIRFLTSGESHGECLNAIIEGIPYGYRLDFDFINRELKERQFGFGRGARMAIESDTIKIKSGVRHSITLASPICLEINNRDWQNWLIPMSVCEVEQTAQNLEKIEQKKITKFRPAHADLAAHLKYGYDDLRNSLERSSARETAARVAVGAICQNILKNYNIEFSFEVLSVGEYVFGISKENVEEYIKPIQAQGDSLGGLIKLTVKNPPAGLGSFVHWDRRLDGRLAQAIMSIPAVKSVEFGLGKEYAKALGSDSHDEIFYDNKNSCYYHKTNNSGGIEGGMSNGEDIIITLAMKPIPTMKKALQSVDMITHAPIEAHFERADCCAVWACGTVAKNMAAIIILDEFLRKFGADTKEEIDRAFKNHNVFNDWED